jgi:hypothetical protein
MKKSILILFTSLLLSQASNAQIVCDICTLDNSVCNTTFTMPVGGTLSLKTTPVNGALYAWSVTGGLQIIGARNGSTVVIQCIYASPANQICVSKSIDGQAPCCQCYPVNCGTASCPCDAQMHDIRCEMELGGDCYPSFHHIISLDANVTNPYPHQARVTFLPLYEPWCDAVGSGYYFDIPASINSCVVTTVPYQYDANVPSSGPSFHYVRVFITDLITNAQCSKDISGKLMPTCSGGAYKPSGEVIEAGKSDLKGNLVIFPNPAEKFVTIRYSIQEEGAIKIIVRNSQGLTLKATQINNKSGEFKVDVKDFNNGIYYVNIIFKNGLIKGDKSFVVSK